MSKTKKVEATVVADERCKSEGCKHAQARFTFCTEHFDWFKFGLITKMGVKVSDFEKKYSHYVAHQQTLKKVA